MTHDIWHYIGGDAGTDPTGDLQEASTTETSQQLVLRRLLTNPGDYIFHSDYGAGLQKYVGAVINIPEMRALIRGQMALEASVAPVPEPDIEIAVIQSGVAIRIQYTERATGEVASLDFKVEK